MRDQEASPAAWQPQTYRSTQNLQQLLPFKSARNQVFFGFKISFMVESLLKTIGKDDLNLSYHSLNEFHASEACKPEIEQK